jgi:hypothetical protein
MRFLISVLGHVAIGPLPSVLRHDLMQELHTECRPPRAPTARRLGRGWRAQRRVAACAICLQVAHDRFTMDPFPDGIDNGA